MIKLHKDYGAEQFAYREVIKAWQAINGVNSEGRFFFVGRLEKPLPNGEFMAYLRRPNKTEGCLLDVPFDYDGFRESANAEQAIFTRAQENLGWRIREIRTECLPK